MYAVGDLVRVRDKCEGRIKEVWGEPMIVVDVREPDLDSIFYSRRKNTYACKFTPDGNTWFARDGIINYFAESEIEYRVPPKPKWEV